MRERSDWTFNKHEKAAASVGVLITSSEMAEEFNAMVVKIKATSLLFDYIGSVANGGIIKRVLD